MVNAVTLSTKIGNLFSKSGRVQNRLMRKGVNYYGKDFGVSCAGDFYSKKLADGSTMIMGYANCAEKSGLTSDVTYIIHPNGSYDRIFRSKGTRYVENYSSSGLIDKLKFANHTKDAEISTTGRRVVSENSVDPEHHIKTLIYRKNVPERAPQ